MGKIHVLDKFVAELIAAGEVVERPASIVKELLENAIDAGATAVTVEIQRGGIQYVRVTDNGSGIQREDVPTAFIRHATSKVRSADDLSSIATMGFRGEALASIAAMCRVELLTRTREETAGTLCVIQGGEIQDLSDAGCPVGTTVTVRDVFFNTPARMKFLKKDTSEGNSVAMIVDKLALAHPEIKVKLIRDGQTKLQTPGDGELLSAIRSVLGKDASLSMMPVGYTHSGITVSGFISRPDQVRASRGLQNFFINRRFIRSKTCMAALEEAYKGGIMIGKFPGCVLRLEIPYEVVDVNVHPAKIEVRFSNEKSIFDAVYYACKSALSKEDVRPRINAQQIASKITPLNLHLPTEIPQQQRLTAKEYREGAAVQNPFVQPIFAADREGEQPVIVSSMSVGTASAPTFPQEPRVAIPYTAKNRYRDTSPVCEHSECLGNTAHISHVLYSEISAPKVPFRLDVSAELKQEELPVQSDRAPLATAQNPFENAKVIGELFGTYIIVQNEDSLVLVDKHAAHERLIYNRLRQNAGFEERQLLLSPVSVSLSRDEYVAVTENFDLIERLGIKLEDFGDGCVIAREIAAALAQCNIEDIVCELAMKLQMHRKELLPQALDDLYHTMACRSAIKARDKNDRLELHDLIRVLSENTDVKHCPHGRSISVVITKRELEKMFGRLG